MVFTKTLGAFAAEATFGDICKVILDSGRMMHPIIWEHESGRKSLLIGNHADRVLGMPLADGRALLTRLLEWAGQPAFTYSHQWQEGDLVVWDNCDVMHRVVPYPVNSGRSMHRTTIAGTETVQGSRPYNVQGSRPYKEAS